MGLQKLNNGGAEPVCIEDDFFLIIVLVGNFDPCIKVKILKTYDGFALALGPQLGAGLAGNLGMPCLCEVGIASSLTSKETGILEEHTI